MRGEGAGCRTAGIRHQHGGLDLQEAAGIQIVPDAAENSGTVDEGLAHVLVHHQIHVALPVAQIGIGQAVILLRQGLERLREQGNRAGTHRDFAALGAEHRALHADDVANVQLAAIGKGFLAHVVHLDIELNPARPILQIGEDRLAHAALGHDATGNTNGLLLQLVETVSHVLRVVGNVKLGNLEGVSPLLLQGLQLFVSHTHLIYHRHLRLRIKLCHTVSSL